MGKKNKHRHQADAQLRPHGLKPLPPPPGGSHKRPIPQRHPASQGPASQGPAGPASVPRATSGLDPPETRTALSDGAARLREALGDSDSLDSSDRPGDPAEGGAAPIDGGGSGHRRVLCKGDGPNGEDILFKGFGAAAAHVGIVGDLAVKNFTQAFYDAEKAGQWPATIAGKEWAFGDGGTRRKNRDTPARAPARERKRARVPTAATSRRAAPPVDAPDAPDAPGDRRSVALRLLNILEGIAEHAL
jgi:hypothetical protein